MGASESMLRLPPEMRQEHERLARAVEQAITPPDMTQVPA
jgi:hypothetical protein